MPPNAGLEMVMRVVCTGQVGDFGMGTRGSPVAGGVAAGVSDRGYNAYVVVNRDPVFGLIEGFQGFGGHPRWVGDKVLDGLVRLWRDRDEIGDPGAWPGEALHVLHRELVAENARLDEDSAIGATATIGLVDAKAGSVHVAHVGASRLYLFRAGELVQLTIDHTIGADLVAGGMSPAEVFEHPARSVLTRYLGRFGSEPGIDSFSIDVGARDRLVFVTHEMEVCSDGELATILTKFANPDDAAREMVAAGSGRATVAYDMGVTVVVVPLP